MLKKGLIIYTGLVLGLLACKVDPKVKLVLPADNLSPIVPPGWPQPVYTFSDNPVTREAFVLGRALFYETMLSQDNTISCGDCHQIAVAFANAGHDKSHGVGGIRGLRNSPALFNLAWHPTFMHDGGIVNIERQPLAPITNPIEMAENINNVVAKLQASSKYRNLFKDAYGSEEVNTDRMFKSMAQFMALIYSYDSRYDYYKRGENNVQFNEAEQRGYALFQAKCNSCHKEPLFSDFAYRNNGLKYDPDPALRDSGRAHITQLSEDRFKFKTPSLRNIEITGPYMHDGSLETLDDCLNHYTNGVTNHINLDPLLEPNGIPMTAQEKEDIKAFLHTLTDYKLINDIRFKNPNTP
jgi:cytochrome c peroxidase